jgi:hypothetical protein
MPPKRAVTPAEGEQLGRGQRKRKAPVRYGQEEGSLPAKKPKQTKRPAKPAATTAKRATKRPKKPAPKEKKNVPATRPPRRSNMTAGTGAEEGLNGDSTRKPPPSQRAIPLRRGSL